MSVAGAVAVGRLENLAPVAVGAVMCLRLWRDDEEALGGSVDPSALVAFRAISTLFGRHGRRPIMRHAPDCACLGADEAIFAELVQRAVEGEQEDAMLIAALIVRPDMAGTLAGLAAEFGLCLHRQMLRAHRLH